MTEQSKDEGVTDFFVGLSVVSWTAAWMLFGFILGYVSALP